MKKTLFLIAAALIACTSVQAQGVLDRLARGAKNAAENAVQRNVEKHVENAVDNAFNKNKNSNENKEEATEANAEDSTQPEAAPVKNDNPKKPANQMSWNNYDFVAGDEIIFDDDQENEKLGEFPSRWDLYGGASEIVAINNKKCINWLDGSITPLMASSNAYLTSECTIEFDIYIRKESVWVNEYSGGNWAAWHNFTLALPHGDKVSSNNENYAFAMTFNNVYDSDNAEVQIIYNWLTPGDASERREGSYTMKNIETEAWHHVALSFNKRAMKVYFDNQRIANIPNMLAPSFAVFNSNQNSERTFFIKDVRIAKGAVPLYDRLASEGKIVTYGITFETGKATIRPESMGEINRIKDIMTKDATIKFEVQGHCDNTGSAAVNNKLSQERAEAIVAKLVEMGIDSNRLTAVGKGASMPVADNNTDEGRAKNRRVEFVVVK